MLMSRGVMSCKQNRNNFLDTLLKLYSFVFFVITVGAFALSYIAPITPQLIIEYYTGWTFCVFVFCAIAWCRVDINRVRAVGIVATALLTICVFTAQYISLYSLIFLEIK